MPQYRSNLITGQLVIIAGARDKRPQDFAVATKPEGQGYNESCPFCLGNESQTPPEVFAIRPEGTPPDSEGWSVRVVPNKFPFLRVNHTAEDNIDVCDYGTVPAGGFHEVLIESPHHSCHFSELDSAAAYEVMEVLRRRYRFHQSNESIRHICIFKNHGHRSGASLSHPHFQIAAASSVVSPAVASHVRYCCDYYDAQHLSVFDAVIEQELACGQRLIIAGEHFVAFCPFASMYPFEVYIVPRSRQSDFGAIDGEQLAELTEVVQKILARLKQGLNDPDYNLLFHTGPVNSPDIDSRGFRFYLRLCPRLTNVGGYELSTDTYINTVEPESAGQFYRAEV